MTADRSRPLTRELAIAKCHIGEGARTCRYIVVGPNGMECAATDDNWTQAVDQSWATTKHTAQGLKCNDPMDDTSETEPSDG